MNDAIVVLNAGAASLQFSIYRVRDEDLTLAVRGRFERLDDAPHFLARDPQGRVLADSGLAAGAARVGHREALQHLLGWAGEEFGSDLSPAAIGHRVAHGGAEFVRPTLLDDDVVAKLDRLVPLAPLQQPHNLAAIHAARSVSPELPQVACFDTAFHRGRADVAERFALPNELYESGVRRWGFHGLSCASVIERLHRVAPDIAAGRVIVVHIGSGASICAVRDGRSVDSTAGFSALDGLPTGTRCGSLDPGVVLFLMKSRSVQQVEAILDRQSGLLGVSGVSDDIRVLLASDHPQAARAVDFFVYRAVREIASLTAAMSGVDALVFTAEIGERSPTIRERICRALAWLGVAVETSANERGRGCISAAGRSPSVWVIPADEDEVVAAGTWGVVRGRVNLADGTLSGSAAHLNYANAPS